MPSINRKLLPWVCLLILNGCSLLPLPDLTTETTGQQTEAENKEEDSESSAKTTIERQPLPNPYLNSDKKIPAQARTRFDLAQLEMQSQHWPRAIAALQPITENSPQLSGPWLNLGIAHSRMNDLDAAETAFSRAIESNSKNVFAYNQLALLHRQQGRFEQALENYQKALEVWPDYLDARINIAILYDLYLGRKDLALNHYQAALELSPEPDRKLKGWILDLQRQTKSPQAGQ